MITCLRTLRKLSKEKSSIKKSKKKKKKIKFPFCQSSEKKECLGTSRF